MITLLVAGVLLPAAFASGSTGRAQGTESPRVRTTINDGWRYAPGDIAGAAGPEFRDSAWTAVTLPHTWNLEDAFTKELGYRRGVGWYRTRLTLDPALRGQRLFLHFEGANQVADVYVNGRHAGRHVGGYTAFAFDVTELVTFDRPTLLAVRVDNSHDPDIPPLNADFTFYGGIYRDVWLIATGPVHVTVLDHASPGVFIDTPDVSADAATVRVRGTVVNATKSPARVQVVNRILAPDGAEVAVLRSSIRIPAGGSAPFRQTSARIARPRLWSPAAPALYRVVTEVRQGGVLLDRLYNPLGFRWFRVDPQRGFALNGSPLRLYGTNRHQDREGYGNAVPDWVHREDVRHVKATGFNFLRLAHYPQDPVVLDECDRRGLLVWEEIPVVNLITMSDAFGDHAERMLVEMIRQHYNHPSILMWGYMNEVMLVLPRPLPEEYHERVVALARRLEARAKAEDPTRPTVTAISFGEVDNGTGLQNIPDILGLNLYFGWYYRSLAALGPWLDSLHRRHPGRPIIVSEYGADSDERIHTREGRAFDFSTEYQQRFHMETFPQLVEREWLVGTAVWNQFDFGVKGRHDSKPNLNQKGLFYFDRRPKDIAAYYQARLRRQPVLRIATRDWLHRAGSRPEDRVQPVIVYSNLDTVELFLGAASLGTRAVTNGAAQWDVRFADGENRLSARGGGARSDIEDAVIVTYEDRATSPATIAVNAGSHYQYVDPSGTVYEADRPYAPGGWGHQGGHSLLIHHRIFGTGDDPLFQAALDSAATYRFDVPDGRYQVRVGLVEPTHDSPGERIFSVRVNGQPLFTDLDLAARHGRYTAVERAIDADAIGGRGLLVQLDARVGVPIISSIFVRRLP